MKFWSSILLLGLALASYEAFLDHGAEAPTFVTAAEGGTGWPPRP
jgi:hypothetical protein